MILQSYIQYLTYEKRFSGHTIVAYQSDLFQFKNFLLASYDVDDVLLTTQAMARTWMVQLMQDDLDVRSIRRKRSVLNSFFNFAIKQEAITKNPLDQIAVPMFKKKLPGYLREGELTKLEAVLPEMTDISTARDRTTIELLYSTGIRRSELINMKLSDIRLAEGSIRVLGKRSKERIIPITKPMAQTLEAYLAFRAADDVPHESLFYTDNHKPLYPKFVYNLVKRYLTMVTAAEAKGPHTLRHTFATLMLDEGADINAIKELLGHADLNATQVYTHTSIEKLKTAYGNAHPRAMKERLKTKKHSNQ